VPRDSHAVFDPPPDRPDPHAHSGDRIAIAAYLGSADIFDKAIIRFAAAYAGQNERDHQSLVDAVAAGRITAEPDM
jgi:Uncharacterized protein conserved in bacteria (DUF2252)